MGITARDQKIELPIAWTDCWGKRHDSVTGNPVAFHAMRGLAAHSNGFQTIRSLSILMSLLGTIDRPGGFRHKAPYPRAVPPNARPPKGPQAVKPNTPLDGAPLGWPESPDDLFVDDQGQPVRIDKGFSWEHPLSAHGLMQNVITNAWRGDPYRIDTLLIFMANMAWNSTMNTSEVRQMLNDKHADGDKAGEYKIPFLVVCDAFQSEMTAFADLILPDTTYLERHDCMSMLDRPISEFDGPVDAVRIPVVAPKGECKPFQEVLVELAGRLKLPAFTQRGRHAQVQGLHRFHRQLRNRARLGHRLPGRLARQGRREIHARRAQPQAMGDVREEQLRLSLPDAAWSTSTCATGTGATWSGRKRSASGATRTPSSSTSIRNSCRAFAARRRASAPGKQPPDAPAQAGRDLFRSAAVSLRPARRAGHRHGQIPAQRHHPAPHGDVPLLGLAKRLAAPDSHPQLPVCEHQDRAGAKALPTAAGCGSSRSGARCAACAATPRPWSPARSGPGTPSASRPAPGT